jgi:hypothetical protein
MTDTKSTLIKEYFHKVKQANKEHTKKEAFKDLLNRLYNDDKDILRLVDKISLGSEKTVLNIPRKDKLHKGSADTLYNKIIIEFENDLKQTLTHAREQLAGYLLGQFNSGEGYNFTLIASDFITWKVYAPAVECIDKLKELKEDELKLEEVKSASFVLNEKNAEDFYYWIDRFLFKEEKQRATLKRIEEAFGYQSNVFIDSYQVLSNWFNEAKKYGEVQVSYEQWNKFLSVAYGSFDGRESIFLIHTYLSVFSKMLAYSVVSNDDYIDDKELKAILDGSIFHKYNIRKFVDNDFYHWVVNDRNFKSLKKVFRLIAQEISSFDFEKVDEDVLKGVYQELIDLDTRHSLGEYYTPDWLCERIVKEFEFKPTDKILDPACGSGSFLRAAIHRIKELNPGSNPETINEQIYGIDIHPLSVQIAKTTLLLALGKEIIDAKNPVYLNIILANTLLAPEGVENLFGKDFTLNIDKEKYKLTTQVLDDVKLFDEALEICDELAEQTMSKKIESEEVFENILRKKLKGHSLNKQIIESFYKVYTGLKSVKEKGRDSIWKFIVQNLYKPYFLAGKFDYVIGNPPWFTYSSIRNEEYQELLNTIADIYDVKPKSIKNFPNLEIAAIFLSYCNSYFLKDNGSLAFVLPRSFFSSDHHDNTRSGKAKGFQISAIWDLNDVKPLFRVPSCVLFTNSTSKQKNFPTKGVAGKSFIGTLPIQNCNYQTSIGSLTETTDTWYLRKQGKSSAFSSKKTKVQSKSNPYKTLFKRGAEITPRNFYFIDVNQEIPTDWKDRIINIKSSEHSKREAKKPWNIADLAGKTESKFIFSTALSKSILPFALINPDLIVLPVEIIIDNGLKNIRVLSVDELRENGYLNASKWFQSAENFWSINKTDRNKDTSSIQYLDFHKKLSSQNINSEYLVIYNASAKDANATVIKRDEVDLEFFVDTKAYVFFTSEANEAFYITAILNSSIPNELMKDFQSKGLFGARDVHKKILDVYFPRFDENIETHTKLAQLSKQAHNKAKQYLETKSPQQELSAIRLGRLRVAIKKHLSEEMRKIDTLVKKVVG